MQPCVVAEGTHPSFAFSDALQGIPERRVHKASQYREADDKAGAYKIIVAGVTPPEITNTEVWIDNTQDTFGRVWRRGEIVPPCRANFSWPVAD